MVEKAFSVDQFGYFNKDNQESYGNQKSLMLFVWQIF
jgi:hypothetical protein